MRLIIFLIISALTPFAHAADCSSGYRVNEGDSEQRLSELRDLFLRGTATPLSDFLTLWFPESGDGSGIDSALFNCERNTEFGYEIPYPQPEMGQPIGNRPVADACRADVLYAWGSLEKSRSLLERFPDGEAWTGIANPHSGVSRAGMIMTTMSSVSTFGFGRTLLRYKIKRAAPYTHFSFDASLDQVRVLSGTYHEFEFRDAALIESVSFGTPEIYDEVVRDLLRFQRNERVFVYSSRPLKERGPGLAGIERLYNQNVDNHEQTEEVLKLNLLELIREILAREGRVHFASGACRDPREAFSTRFPSHIQPRQSLAN